MAHFTAKETDTLWCCSSGSLQKAWRSIPPSVCSTTCDKFRFSSLQELDMTLVAGIAALRSAPRWLRPHRPERLYARRPLTPQCLAARVYNGPETRCASGCVSSLTCFHLHVTVTGVQTCALPIWSPCLLCFITMANLDRSFLHNMQSVCGLMKSFERRTHSA